MLAAGGAAIGYVLYVRSAGADVRGNSQEFSPADTSALPEGLSPVAWPTFGYDSARLHVAAGSLRAPFRVAWTIKARTLLENPPPIRYGKLSFANNSGTLYALRTATGAVDWSYDSNRCVAASPAVANGVVYEAFLNRPPCNSTRSDIDGRIVAFDAGTGVHGSSLDVCLARAVER